jgi:hypothetical protein
MGLHRTTEKEFGIPPAQLEKSIHPEVLSIFGIARPATPTELHLGLVMVDGYSYGNAHTWAFTARSGHQDDTQRYLEGDPEVIYGTMQVSADRGSRIEPQDALSQAEEWIRDSQNTEWMPGSIYPLPVPEDMQTCGVAGLLVVRATIQ